MHKLSIIHRDLKPENVVFKSKDAEAEIKLIDFGHSKVDTYDNTQLAEQTACRTYTANASHGEGLVGTVRSFITFLVFKEFKKKKY